MNPAIRLFWEQHKQRIKTILRYTFVVAASMYVCYTCYINGYRWGYDDGAKVTARR